MSAFQISVIPIQKTTHKIEPTSANKKPIFFPKRLIKKAIKKIRKRPKNRTLKEISRVSVLYSLMLKLKLIKKVNKAKTIKIKAKFLILFSL